MKRPKMWLVEYWTGKSWQPCELVARETRKRAVQEAMHWGIPSAKYRPAKYERVEP